MRLADRIPRSVAILSLAVMLLVPSVARSQGPGPGDGGPSPRIEDFRETLTILMMTRMRSELDLTKDQAEQIFPKIEEMEKSRQESALARRRAAMLLKALLLDPSAKDTDFSKIVDTLNALDEADHKRDQSFFADVRKVLAPRQQAQFLDFRQRFRGWLEERMREMRDLKPTRNPARPGPRGRGADFQDDRLPGEPEERPKGPK